MFQALNQWPAVKSGGVKVRGTTSLWCQKKDGVEIRGTTGLQWCQKVGLRREFPRVWRVGYSPLMPTDAPMISVSDLSVYYGDVHAVVNVNLEIPTGEVFGLIGPNGAGKTSMMRVLAGLQEPTFGRVKISGIDLEDDRRQAHAKLGYMPDFAPVDEDLKVWEFLEMYAAAYGIPADKRRERIDYCISLVNLDIKSDALCKGLSRGMKQRITLAKTLLHDPPLLILDEPASGLDPKARMDLRDIFRSLAARGKTVLISSHILTELSAFCTSIGVMEQGHLRVSGKLQDVIDELEPKKLLTIELLRPSDSVDTVLLANGVQDIKRDSSNDLILNCTFDNDRDWVASLLVILVKEGIPICGIYERQFDVEDIFMKLGTENIS